MAPTQSGLVYKGTQSFEGKWAGTGFYPEETLKYFDFYFKGKQAEHTGYMPNELLFETLTTNSPDITVLDIERRNFDSETMAAIRQAEEAVFKRWSKTDEGRAEASKVAKEREKRHGGGKKNDFLEALSGMTAF